MSYLVVVVEQLKKISYVIAGKHRVVKKDAERNRAKK